MRRRASIQMLEDRLAGSLSKLMGTVEYDVAADDTAREAETSEAREGATSEVCEGSDSDERTVEVNMASPPCSPR